MDTIQIDSVIYRILTENGALQFALSGDIYTAGERPENSDKEDIVISAISYQHSTPAQAVSNINIHVPDIAVNIGGTPQYKTNRDRLRDLTEMVVYIIEGTTIEGVGLHVDTTQVFAEPNAHEHYMNIRASWLIAKPYTSELDIRQNPLLRQLADLERRVAALETAATTPVQASETNNEPTEPSESTEPEPLTD